MCTDKVKCSYELSQSECRPLNVNIMANNPDYAAKLHSLTCSNNESEHNKPL